MKPKTVRYLSRAALLPLAFEVLPHAAEKIADCSVGMELNLCSASDVPWAVEPRNYHTPHLEFETHVGAGYGWIASGQAIASTSTGPSHWMTFAGESIASRGIK